MSERIRATAAIAEPAEDAHAQNTASCPSGPCGRQGHTTGRRSRGALRIRRKTSARAAFSFLQEAYSTAWNRPAENTKNVGRKNAARGMIRLQGTATIIFDCFKKRTDMESLFPYPLFLSLFRMLFAFQTENARNKFSLKRKALQAASGQRGRAYTRPLSPYFLFFVGILSMMKSSSTLR